MHFSRNLKVALNCAYKIANLVLLPANFRNLYISHRKKRTIAMFSSLVILVTIFLSGYSSFLILLIHEERTYACKTSEELYLQLSCKLRAAKESATDFLVLTRKLIWTKYTCGTPPGAGGIPVKWNLPSRLLSRVRDLSPSYTCTWTDGWLSAYVENTYNHILF